MYKCKICNKEFKVLSMAEACEESHEYIYVKLKRKDLFKLMQFLYSGDRSLLSESLMSDLRKYTRGTYV
jgi:hypothetical protein